MKNCAGSTPGIGISDGIGLREEEIGVRGVAPAKFLKVVFEPFPGLVETRDA